METYIPGTDRMVRYTSSDLSDRAIARPVHIMQYDNQIPIICVALYNEGEPYEIPETITSVNIRLGKSDGTFVYNPALGISEDKTMVYFEATQQMTLVAGSITAIAELCIGSEIAQTGYIYITIDENPINQSKIESTDEFKTMTEYVDEAKDYANTAQTAATASGDYSAQSKNHADEAEGYLNAIKEAAETTATNAQNAKDSEEAAAKSASDAAETASSVATELANTVSAYAEAAGQSADDAKQYAADASSTASKLDESVKEYADAAAKSASDAAETASKLDESVKEYADNAAESAKEARKAADDALNTIGIDDDEISETNSWSSQKIADEIAKGGSDGSVVRVVSQEAWDELTSDEQKSGKYVLEGWKYSQDESIQSNADAIETLQSDVTDAKAALDDLGDEVAAYEEATDKIVEENQNESNKRLEVLEKVAHSHENKEVLDNFSESDGILLYKGEKIKGGGGLEIPPKTVTNLVVKASDETLKVSWNDPENNVVDGTTFATWAGTILVINDDHMPADETDGTVLVTNTVRDQYASTGYEITGLTNNQTYYIRLIPYTTAEVYGYDDANCITGKPAKVLLDDVTDITVTAGDKTVTVTWTNPEQTKTQDDVTATWAKTTVILSADGLSENLTYESTDYSEGSHEFTVENGYDYAVEFLIESDLGSVKETKYDETVATYATVTVSTEEETLVGAEVKVTWTDGDEEHTLTDTLGAMNFVQFKIPYRGSVTFESTDGQDTATKSIDVTGWDTYAVKLQFYTPPTFAEGSWAEIIEACEKAEAGDIDISDYWAVGDTKTGVPLTAMAATGVGESHAAQNVSFVIIGINHDTIASGTYSGKKAAITIAMVDSLNEIGYMNSAYNAYTYGCYSTSARRTWINNIFEKSLPSELQKGIKTVSKSTCEAISGGNSSLKTSTERCFLASNWEVFGAAYSGYCAAQDGTQYEYYKTTANRIKKVNGTANYWWTRSGFWHASYRGARFVLCSTSGAARDDLASGATGLSLCLCI